MIQQFHFWEYIQRNKNSNLRRYLYPHVHSNIIYSSQYMEITWVSIDGWMEKEFVIYIYMCVCVCVCIYM